MRPPWQDTNAQKNTALPFYVKKQKRQVLFRTQGPKTSNQPAVKFSSLGIRHRKGCLQAVVQILPCKVMPKG